MTGNRADALARLDVFVGEWVVEARFPGSGDAPAAHSTFEWALDRQFLIQRTEVPVPEAPDGLMIVSADPETKAPHELVRIVGPSIDRRQDPDVSVRQLHLPRRSRRAILHVRRFFGDEPGTSHPRDSMAQRAAVWDRFLSLFVQSI